MQKILRKVIAELQDLEASLESTQVIFLQRNYAGLTERELETIEHMCAGFHSKEIAGKMSISVRTVEFYRSCILQKLQCRTIAQMITLLYKAKIIK